MSALAPQSIPQSVTQLVTQPITQPRPLVLVRQQPPPFSEEDTREIAKEIATGIATEISEPHAHFVQTLAVVVFEIIEGTRSMNQLGGSVTIRAARQITHYRAARQDQRRVLGTSPLTVRHIGRVRIDRPTPTVAEAAAVVYAGQRARAVAVRLEWEHSRWRASDITVL